jgi:hypothetical protein
VLATVAAAALGCAAEEDTAQSGRCEYPSGEYGFMPGQVPPPTLSWEGIDENGKRTTISIADYHDCDGSRGINAILIDQSTVWCGVCRRLAKKLAEKVHGEWNQRGIHVITLITQAADTTPATADTAMQWRRQFQLDGSAVVADPLRSFRETAGQQMAPYPYEIMIDPRTMKITSVDAGYRGEVEFVPLVNLARTNARE